MSLLGHNILDSELGVNLPMAELPSVAHLPLVLEDDDLLALLLAQDRGHHLGPWQVGSPDRNLAISIYQQNPIHLDGRSGLGNDALDLNNLPWLDPVLLAPCFNYGVNIGPPCPL